MSEERSIVDVSVDKIEKWLKQSGMKESRLGLLACANPRAIQRVRDKTATLQTLEAILAYIERNPAKGVK
jgi:hypothetical protein